MQNYNFIIINVSIEVTVNLNFSIFQEVIRTRETFKKRSLRERTVKVWDLKVLDYICDLVSGKYKL